MKSPLFIVGCGRSGTTLLRKMLNTHPEIGIPLESLFIIDYLKSKKSTKLLINNILKEYEIKEWGIKLKKNDFQNCKTSKDIITKIHALYIIKHNKKYWGQKTPRFIRYGNLLKKVYPDCKFVIVNRDPRAVVNSLIKSNVHRTNALYGSLRWKNDVNEGLKLKKEFPKDALEIKYEDLIKYPEKSLTKVCNFLNIKFSSKMLDYYKEEKEYNAYYRQVHAKLLSKPDKSRIDDWQNKLKPKEIQVVDHICKKQLLELNYKIYSKAKPNFVYLLYLRINRLYLIILQLYHYITKRRGYITSYIRRKVLLNRFF